MLVSGWIRVLHPHFVKLVRVPQSLGKLVKTQITHCTSPRVSDSYWVGSENHFSNKFPRVPLGCFEVFDHTLRIHIIASWNFLITSIKEELNKHSNLLFFDDYLSSDPNNVLDDSQLPVCYTGIEMGSQLHTGCEEIWLPSDFMENQSENQNRMLMDGVEW